MRELIGVLDAAQSNFKLKGENVGVSLKPLAQEWGLGEQAKDKS